MSLTTRLTTWLKKQRSAAPFNFTGSNANPPSRGMIEFLQSYDSNPWVRAAAGKIADSISTTNWKLIRSDTEEEVTQHIALATLKRPNPVMTGSSLIRVTQLSLDLVGDAFWLLVRNGFGAPVEYWPLPPHWIADLPKSDKPYFQVRWGTWNAKVPEADMLWVYSPSPYDPYGRGRGVIQALADELSTDEYAAKHAGQIFFNRAMPDVVVQDVGAGPDEIKMHERAWNDRLRGLYKAMKPYFVNRELTFWQPEQMNLDNLTLVPLRKFERDLQIQCWGIPPEQFGIIEKSNRATAEASDYIYEKRVVQPRKTFLANELTLKLLRKYDPRLELTFPDTTPKNKELTTKLMQSSPSSFYANEIRELAGLEPRDDGQVSAVPLNQYITDDLRDPTQRPTNLPGAPKDDDWKPPDDDKGKVDDGD